MRDVRTEPPHEKDVQLNLYIDGASKGNPGMAGAGVWMTNQKGKKLLGMSRYLGHKTNNEAEYWALLIGLREALRLGRGSIHIFTDSELIARQVKGIYRVKKPHLAKLHAEAMDLIKKNQINLDICYIPREKNRKADNWLFFNPIQSNKKQHQQQDNTRQCCPGFNNRGGNNHIMGNRQPCRNRVKKLRQVIDDNSGFG